jgi:hypothetical protein
LIIIKKLLLSEKTYSMDLVKVYLIQNITAASNNLRLNAQQIEVVGLLRETIINSQDLGSEFLRMKKSTELSKLAIRLSEIYSFLTQGKVDFIKISEQFRDHSRYLIRDLNQFLENVSPQVFRDAFHKLNHNDSKAINVELVDRSNLAGQILVNQSAAIREKIIMEDDRKDGESFHSFELQILEPIKSIDEMLKKMLSGKMVYEELKMYAEIMEEHTLLSIQRGFGILAEMHKIISSAFKGIISGSLLINKSVIESLRACLIVIAAVVKGKEIDITDYLNRAEEFGKKYLEKNIQV